MNKLTEKQVELNDEIQTLELMNNTKYIIKKHIIIENIKIIDPVFSITLELQDNSSLILGSVVTLDNTIGEILIKSMDKTNLSFHLGINARGKNSLKIEHKIEKNENESDIKIRIVGEENSYTKVETIGNILKNTHRNIFTEDVSYLALQDSIIECLPKLYIASDDCNANHFLTIGSISPEILFYLSSKNINNDRAKSLIRTCFIENMKIRKEDINEY